ncbi:peptidylprolyl isomerase [Neisseria sp.]|uniref:peptidylprolyl isomerase n=1 Tax=Neisseria sp. TaxID=192066 RepID=UPI0035A04B32
MKSKTVLTAAVLTAAVGIAAAAQAPQIDTGRIDSMVEQYMRQADANPHQTQKPDGAAIRKDVIRRLQTFEVLKKEAFKAGLDKNPEIQNRFKNVEAQFYAGQFALHLESQTEISEAELRAAYDAQTRVVQILQVGFNTEAEARSAHGLLRKGLSFEELVKRHPSKEQGFDGYVNPQQLPPEIANIIAPMTRGQITSEPVALNGRFYLFKLAAVDRNPEAPPLEQVRTHFLRQAKQIKVQQQIDKILQENGVGK